MQSFSCPWSSVACDCSTLLLPQADERGRLVSALGKVNNKNSMRQQSPEQDNWNKRQCNTLRSRKIRAVIMNRFDTWTREVFFGDGGLTHCDTATAERGLAQGIYIHSIEPRNNYLKTKRFFCDTNRVDWKWVTSVEYNLERFWIRLRRDKDGKWCECIWLLLCPFRTQRVISIPCLPPMSAAKKCEYDYTLISRPHTQNRVARVGARSWLAGGDITVERCLLVLLICLFVIEWPQGCPSSANSGSHRDFLSWAGHYGNLDKKAECRESFGLQKIMLLSFRAFNVKANTMHLISLAEALSAVALKDTNIWNDLTIYLGVFIYSHCDWSQNPPSRSNDCKNHL